VIDLDLIEPAGVDGQVDEDQGGPAALEAGLSDEVCVVVVIDP